MNTPVFVLEKGQCINSSLLCYKILEEHGPLFQEVGPLFQEVKFLEINSSMDIF